MITLKKHEIDLSMFQLHTDLIIDNIENNKNIIKNTIKEKEIKITKVKLKNNIENKKKGNYITIEFKDATDSYNRENLKNIFIKYLKEILKKNKIKPEDKCLVIGLGNRESTPDSLGPKTLNNILVTNHLFDLENVDKNYRRVSIFEPSVTGKTGIETSELIKTISNNYDFIIVIDALASKSIDRLNKTIQMTDTGIHPGSGIGNTRKEISYETIKKRVIAIGIPTVVDAVTIVTDTIKYLYQKYSYTKENINKPSNRLTYGNRDYKNNIEINENIKKEIFGLIGTLNEDEIQQLFYEVLTPIGYNMMVTTKEIDYQIEILSKVIGEGINKSLHKI